jgi:hypothetical protein
MDAPSIRFARASDDVDIAYAITVEDRTWYGRWAGSATSNSSGTGRKGDVSGSDSRGVTGSFAMTGAAWDCRIAVPEASQ